MVAPRRRPGASPRSSQCTRVGRGRVLATCRSTLLPLEGRPVQGLPRLPGAGACPSIIDEEVCSRRDGGRLPPVGAPPPSVFAGCAADGCGRALRRPPASRLAPRSTGRRGGPGPAPSAPPTFRPQLGARHEKPGGGAGAGVRPALWGRWTLEKSILCGQHGLHPRVGQGIGGKRRVDSEACHGPFFGTRPGTMAATYACWEAPFY